MGTPKTMNKLSRDGKSKDDEKTAMKKKVKVDEEQVQQEKNKKKDTSSKINGTVKGGPKDLTFRAGEPQKSEIKKQSNGNPNDSAKKRRRMEREKEEEEEEEESKLYVFPMNRVQRIAKSEGSDLKMSQEAYFLINKAMEKFIGQFCEDAYDSAPPRDRKGFFKYRHLASVVCKEKRYDFLSDFVPEKIKVEDALKDINPEET